MKYEYLVCERKDYGEVTLNSLGKKGWKLVSVVKNSYEHYNYYFIREVEVEKKYDL